MQKIYQTKFSDHEPYKDYQGLLTFLGLATGQYGFQHTHTHFSICLPLPSNFCKISNIYSLWPRDHSNIHKLKHMIRYVVKLFDAH